MIEKSPEKSSQVIEKSPLRKPNEGDTDSSNVDWQRRKRVFSFLLYVVIFTNFDTGVIPACVDEIEAEMDIGKVGIAALGSLPFFAISLASLMVSFIIRKFGSKKTLFVSLAANILVCVVFAFSYDLGLLYVSRFLMGFTQAFWVIYAPVWTNHSSPVKQQSTWLGTLQGFSPLGIILGYMTTGIVIENWDASYAWRLVIIFQAICEIPVLFAMFWVNNEDLDILTSNKLVASLETLDHENNNNKNPQNSAENELDSFSHLLKDIKVLIFHIFLDFLFEYFRF